MAQGGQLLRGGAGLLLQLPQGGVIGVLPPLQLPCRDLQQRLLVGVTVLGDGEHIVVLIQGQDANPAGVVDDLAGGGMAVWQLHLVHMDLDNPPVEDGLALQSFFDHFHLQWPPLRFDELPPGRSGRKKCPRPPGQDTGWPGPGR